MFKKKMSMKELKIGERFILPDGDDALKEAVELISDLVDELKYKIEVED